MAPEETPRARLSGVNPVLPCPVHASLRARGRACCEEPLSEPLQEPEEVPWELERGFLRLAD